MTSKKCTILHTVVCKFLSEGGCTCIPLPTGLMMYSTPAKESCKCPSASPSSYLSSPLVGRRRTECKVQPWMVNAATPALSSQVCPGLPVNVLGCLRPLTLTLTLPQNLTLTQNILYAWQSWTLELQGLTQVEEILISAVISCDVIV